MTERGDFISPSSQSWATVLFPGCFQGCSSKLPQTWWLKITEICSITLDQNQEVNKAAQSLNALGEEPAPCDFHLVPLVPPACGPRCPRPVALSLSSLSFNSHTVASSGRHLHGYLSLDLRLVQII